MAWSCARGMRVVTKLRLYVTGETPTAKQVVARIREILETYEEYELEVLDVFEHPEQAFDDMVTVTPTLVRVLPLPIRRLIGDLGNRERVLAGLEIVRDEQEG